MNLQKCSNGHYYDGDTYQGCPHCGKQSPDDNQTISLDFATMDGGEVTVPIDQGLTTEIESAMQTSTMGTGLFDDQKTVSFYPDRPVLAAKDPVVGWLVCVGGDLYGQDFRLKSGRNFIGRGDQMDVCLSGQSTVSRDRHAIIIYEPKQNVFLAQPGETKELIYLNETVVLMPTVMKKNDILQVGNILLMLVPCCDEVYVWKDEEKEYSSKI